MRLTSAQMNAKVREMIQKDCLESDGVFQEIFKPWEYKRAPKGDRDNFDEREKIETRRELPERPKYKIASTIVMLKQSKEIKKSLKKKE